ncbi:MAG: KamA family radical SAM protein [Clostridiales bacterium]|nr:KamA family radical SAM protein [Clostridiales bacterium]
MIWQEELRRNVETAEELAKYLPMTEEEIREMDAIIEKWPMSVPRYYLSLIDFNDPNDPIAKLSLPNMREIETDDGLFDQSGEGKNTKLIGLQHKYGPTALLLSTNLCGMYCRHCFRKRLVGLTESETAQYFDEVYEYVESHKELTNVLVSGGDSFLNSNKRIEEILSHFSKLSHLDFIRFGTRTPVVFPQRINDDEELLDILEKYGKEKKIYVVTQYNHPNELTEQSLQSIENLRRRGIIVSNQTVLLKGINDDPEILSQLMRGLIAGGVLPYYVFQCRPVAGVKKQFQVPIKDAYDIVSRSRHSLDGHSKRFRYIMSHETGKIEILGKLSENEMLFKYHHAKDPKNEERIFTYKLTDDCSWLPEHI